MNTYFYPVTFFFSVGTEWQNKFELLIYINVYSFGPGYLREWVLQGTAYNNF